MSQTALTPEERAQKIRTYETFVNEVLKGQLQRTLEARDRIFQMQADYMEVERNVRAIQEHGLRKLKTMVNLGSDVYVHAKVPDTTYVFINIGLGVQAQFTLDEALEFLATKEAFLGERGSELSADANRIKARIKLIYEGIHELMGFEGTARQRRPEVFQ